MKEIYGNPSYKVLKLVLASGEVMPRHFVTSDAFIMVEQGQANITFKSGDTVLASGDTLHIPAREPHSVAASEDFKAFIVF
ncbi:cupin domain-containing protein [Pontibacter beigongshangensis]|uniref:cupin domain-containing protein n=1 Tax=Pontibacter beigongshangensis TaxID=2574733 RepID=UPI001F50B637|nr:cupin domain-containing protein [Pontibacter beigongshangensis]